MPDSITTKFTAAHAEVSARVPKSSTSAQTSSPITSAVRKQPSRKSATRRGPGPRKSKPKARPPITAMRAHTITPRPTPTSQEPSAR